MNMKASVQSRVLLRLFFLRESLNTANMIEAASAHPIPAAYWKSIYIPLNKIPHQSEKSIFL
jgi:hypothetical protein